MSKRSSTPSRSGGAAGPSSAVKQQIPFEDSPFLYYPRLAPEIPAEAAPKLIEARLACRSEHDDLSPIKLPILDVEADKVMAESLYCRHLCAVSMQGSSFGKEHDQAPFSGRLIHLAIAKNQRQLVTRFIATHGDLSLRTSPLSCMRELGGHGVQGLHDASITPVVVALWMKRHEILQELLEAGADPIFGAVVQMEGGDKLKAFMREHTDIDRCDFPPTKAGMRRSCLSYALRTTDLKGMEIFLKHCKDQGFLLKITPAEIEDAKKVRRDPAIVAKVEEAAKQGFVRIVEDADADLHPTTGQEDADNPLRKQLATSLFVGRLAFIAIVIVLIVWISIICYQAHDKLEERLQNGTPPLTALDRLYRNHVRQYLH